MNEFEKAQNVRLLDVFFIGPSDLSHSMGYPGRPDTPAVKEAIDSTFAKIVAAGKVPGIPAGADTLQAALDKGVRYTYTHLNRLLVSATSEYFEAARAWTGA